MSSAPRLRPVAAAALAALAMAGCAPPEASTPVSERVLAAPPPYLAPTASFEAPREAGLDAGLRVAAERDALAARAEALRARAAALAEADVLDAEERARLDAPRPPAGEAGEAAP